MCPYGFDFKIVRTLLDIIIEWMAHGEDQHAFGLQHPVELTKNGHQVLDMVKHKRAYDQIERTGFKKIERLAQIVQMDFSISANFLFRQNTISGLASIATT